MRRMNASLSLPRLAINREDVMIIGASASGNRLSVLDETEAGIDGLVEESDYFHVTSMPKKCMKTSRFGLFLGFCCGLRM